MPRKKKIQNNIAVNAFTQDELLLAEKIFKAKHPYITFNLTDCLRELLHKEAFVLGLKREEIRDSFSNICNNILDLTGLLSNFVGQVNRQIYLSPELQEQAMEEFKNMDISKIHAELIDS